MSFRSFGTIALTLMGLRNPTSRRTARRPLRHAVLSDNRLYSHAIIDIKHLCQHLQQVFLKLQSLNLCELPVTHVLHHVSDKFEVSTAFRFWVNHRHGTDGRTGWNTLSPWYKCTGWPKKVSHNFCPYLCQILTDSQNLFTCAFCEKFVVKWLLNIPPHLNCVATLPCETQKCVKFISIWWRSEQEFGT